MEAHPGGSEDGGNVLEQILTQKNEEDYVVIKLRRGIRWRLRCQYLNPIDVLNEINRRNHATLYSSGTLSPLTDSQTLFGAPDAFTRSYPSPFPKDRIFGVHISSYKDKLLTTKYSERSSETLQNYQNALEEIAKIVPNGLLVFFPNYDMVLNTFPDLYDLRSFGGKRVFSPIVEKVKEECLRKYTQYVREGGGAILLSAFRGRESEGFDYSNELARGIVICGIPYADYKDPVVKARQKWFENRRRGAGWRWYEAQAFRAVNQALGRGWRHPKDYCCVFLMDYRFGQRSAKISHWIADRIDWIDRSFQEKLGLVQDFYSSASIFAPES